MVDRDHVSELASAASELTEIVSRSQILASEERDAMAAQIATIARVVSTLVDLSEQAGSRALATEMLLCSTIAALHRAGVLDATLFSPDPQFLSKQERSVLGPAGIAHLENLKARLSELVGG